MKAFNLRKWIEDNSHLLRPPVANKLVFEDSDMVVQVIGGPNRRTDFHDDPADEFFYQLRGDMVLKVVEEGTIVDVPIREGDVFLVRAHQRHSPQRPIGGSVGLVVEGARHAERDGFEWYCFACGGLIHRVEIALTDIVADLPPLFDTFYADMKARTCPHCGALHPGKEPPEGWVSL